MKTTLPFFVSFFIQFLVIRTFCRRAFCMDTTFTDKPQRLHSVPTPRAGGLGIFIAFALAMALVGKSGALILIASLPAYMIGFFEDIRANISPRMRFVVIAGGSVAAIFLSGGVLYDLGLFMMPAWLAVLFTVIAVTGVTNAFNIIDGINGLASGVAIIALIFISAAAFLSGDQLILSVSLVLAATIAGFFVWNFPKGRIFLGDGGAYFIGFILAELSIMLVRRNPDISPWFPLVVLAYPVTEVLFSIYRRKLKRGASAFAPDRIHLHSLIYKRVTKSSRTTSSVIWLMVSVFGGAALMLRANTPALVALFLSFTATYVHVYRSVVRFRSRKIGVTAGGEAASNVGGESA